MKFIEKLSEEHDCSAFSCGKPILDEWLKKYALINQRHEIAQTYILQCSNKVFGYYAITAGSANLADVPLRIAKGMPKHPIPLIVLARLAVDLSVHGQGVGSALLKDALHRASQAADIVGVRAVMVSALDEEAVSFYQRFDFMPSPIDPHILMLLMKDLRASLTSKPS